MTSDADAGQRAVQGLIDGLGQAWSRHDGPAYAALFADDADHVNAYGLAIKGRAEIETWHSLIFRTVLRDSVATLVDTKCRFLRPDVASVEIRWQLAGTYNPQGEPVPVRRGLSAFIATEKHGGGWSIDVLHLADLPPLEAARALAALSATSPTD
jgi:uncharacterized protein (TIGR02246 family)